THGVVNGGAAREVEEKTGRAGEAQSAGAQGAGGGAGIVATDMMKSAMKAFRKRMKRTKREDEGKLGNGERTGGRKSEIAAIMPPRELPKEVWDELVRQGKLRNAGGSFYELGEKL